MSWSSVKRLFTLAQHYKAVNPRIMAMQACCKNGRCFLVPDPDTANCCGLSGGMIIGAASCDPNPCPQPGLQQWGSSKKLLQ